MVSSTVIKDETMSGLAADSAERLRVLHVVEASFAGVGRHVLDLASSQVEHDVHVAYSPLRMSDSFRQEMTRLPSVTWHACNMRRSIGPHDCVAVARLRGIIKRIKPEVVHGHSVKGGALARLAALGCKGSVIYTPNGISSLNPKMGSVARMLNDSIERTLAVSTDKVIAVSQEEQQHIERKIAIDPSKVTMINNGIRPILRFSKTEAREKYGLPKDALIVGFVGRLAKQKAPLDLVRVCAEAADKSDALHFVIVGTGPLEDQAKELAREFRSLEGRLHWLGEQPGTELMSTYDIFLLPSIYEGFPYVLLEAALTGLPIVTTEDACARDIVEHGETGFICKTNVIEEMAERVVELCTDRDKRTAFGLLAKQNAKKFSVERMASQVESVIKELVLQRQR